MATATVDPKEFVRYLLHPVPIQGVAGHQFHHYQLEHSRDPRQRRRNPVLLLEPNSLEEISTVVLKKRMRAPSLS